MHPQLGNSSDNVYSGCYRTTTKFENFRRLVLGCIAVEFCKLIVNTRSKAFDEIYKIYVLLHSSDLIFQHKHVNTFVENRKKQNAVIVSLLLKSIVFRAGFDETSSEFRENV